MRKYLSLIRRCIFCSSIFGREYGICPECELIWQSRTAKETLMPKQNSFDVHRLFIASDRQSQARELAVLLKGDDHPRLWFYFSYLFFLQRLQSEKPLPDSPIIVSAPSSTGREHAQIFANHIADLTGWEHLQVFALKDTDGAQKELSRTKRLNKKLTLKEGRCLNSKNLIFIDDMIVTGGTAMAAYNALRPANYEVWALVHQLLLH